MRTAILLLLLFPCTSFAAPCVTWTHSLQREDGSIMKPEELVGVQLYWQRIAPADKLASSVSGIKTRNKYCYSLRIPGDYLFWGVAIDSDGLESEPSVKVPYTLQ